MKKQTSNTVKVNRKDYDSLVADSLLLDCLKECGVDNWDGWGSAMALFKDAQKEEANEPN